MNVNASGKAEKPVFAVQGLLLLPPCAPNSMPWFPQLMADVPSSLGQLLPPLPDLLPMPSASGTESVLLRHVVVIHCVSATLRKPCNVIARTESGRREKFGLLMPVLFFTRGEQRGSMEGARA